MNTKEAIKLLEEKGYQVIEPEKTLVIGDYEYEIETHDFNKTLDEMNIPEGWELWTASDFGIFTKEQYDKLNLRDDWFFIEHPIKALKGQHFAWFFADSDGAYLDCVRNPTSRYASLGVRFKRRVNEN